MIEGVSVHSAVFINTLGHTSGLLIFGLLTFLLVKSWQRSVSPQRAATLTASCLALAWNLGSLIGLGFPQVDGQIADWLVAINFSILSFLPAVLLSIVLSGKYPSLARAGYLISFCSAALHFAELRLPSTRLHEFALLVMTAGFGVLLLALLILFVIRKPAAIALTDLICLLLFIASFLHFGYGHSRAAWTNEVAWHHAGIPVALIVLLRDFRLLVVETLLRFLANIGLAGLFAASLYSMAGHAHLLQNARGNAFTTAILFAVLCCALVLFAHLRVLTQRRLTESVFRRGDLNVCAKQILLIASESHTERELLEQAAAEIKTFAQADKFEILPESSIAPPAWAEMNLPLRFSRGDALTLVLGPRRGSRRYLAEDLEALRQLANLLVGQVERFRANELQRLAHEAELHALQAQVNPHFLFNALNTLYGTIGRESFEARRLVLNLAELFRYCLKQDRMLIPLGEELQIVQAYLEIESLRLGKRLTFEIAVADDLRRDLIPVLSVQPIVENAIKHGISQLNHNGKLLVTASQCVGALEIQVRDNGPGLRLDSATAGLGMGLENVRKRLHLCFGASAFLKLESSDQGCCVTLSVPATTTIPDRSLLSAARRPAHAVHSALTSTPL